MTSHRATRTRGYMHAEIVEWRPGKRMSASEPNAQSRPSERHPASIRFGFGPTTFNNSRHTHNPQPPNPYLLCLQRGLGKYCISHYLAEMQARKRIPAGSKFPVFVSLQHLVLPVFLSFFVFAVWSQHLAPSPKMLMSFFFSFWLGSGAPRQP